MKFYPKLCSVMLSTWVNVAGSTLLVLCSGRPFPACDCRPSRLNLVKGDIHDLEGLAPVRDLFDFGRPVPKLKMVVADLKAVVLVACAPRRGRVKLFDEEVM